MKKNVSIFFLALFLCNVVGYYVWFAVEQIQAEVAFVQKNAQTINININDSNDGVFIAKINASIYGHVEDTEWEGTGGEFVQNGQYYQMVHQRVLNDTLYIYCVANQKKSELANNFESYVKTYLLDNFGKENNTPSNLKLFKSLIKDFIQTETPHLVRVSWNVHTLFSIAYTEPNPCHSSNYYPVFAPPPEV
ncbi:MAG: hypothetical protein RLZZ292_452 [Bacteroidota bacterium]